jgi:hypothetical protein
MGTRPMVQHNLFPDDSNNTQSRMTVQERETVRKEEDYDPLKV